MRTRAEKKSTRETRETILRQRLPKQCIHSLLSLSHWSFLVPTIDHHKLSSQAMIDSESHFQDQTTLAGAKFPLELFCIRAR